MIPKSFLPYALLLSLAPASAMHAFAASQADQPNYVLVSSPLALDARTAVPGHILAAGNYSIRLVDHLGDRYILRIDNQEGKTLATFIGLRSPEFDVYAALQAKGPVLWAAAPNGSAAMRGFTYPNGTTVEFAYPKAEAVALAKLNPSSVPAIDPESEGRKPDPKLTPEDREVVTLWMLTATRLGANGKTPAIEARRFVASPEKPAPAPATQLATSEPPAQLAAARTAARPAPARVSTVKSKPIASSLPQTGSNLPLMALISAMMLGAAGSLRFARGRA